nr:uncharacterized protein LOC112016340 [Quercus suber]
MCTSSYIRKKLMKKVRRQPNMKLKDIQDVVHEKLTLNITPGKVGRAREKAREYVDEAHTQQYNKLWEYCEELKRASPGNTILMKVHTFNEGDLATEMDLGCKKGFMVGCRPIIGLDACHLKTKSGGQLITAVARDLNEEYFPLVYATSVRTQDGHLYQTSKRVTNTTIVVIVLTGIGADLHWKNHTGVLIKELFWKATKAIYKAGFDRLMDELKGIDEDAHSWLQDHSTTIWARHMFSKDGLSDTVISYDQVSREQIKDHESGIRDMP